MSEQEHKFLSIGDFKFGEIIKIVMGDPDSPEEFLGRFEAKLYNSVKFSNVVHIQTGQKHKQAIFAIMNEGAGCFNFPTEVELSNWMDKASTNLVTYNGKPN